MALDDTTMDELKSEVGEALEEGDTHCISVEYEGADFGFPDPHWSGERPGTVQQTTVEQIRFMSLTLWLTRPTQFAFRTIVHADKYSNEWVIRQISTYDELRPLKQYMGEEHRNEDFEQARSLFKALRTISAEGTIRTSMGGSCTVCHYQAKRRVSKYSGTRKKWDGQVAT